MATDGWPYDSSPFHAGEQRVQTLAGVRDAAEQRARRALRPWMPEQHRAFFAQLSFMLAGAADADGRVWATMLTGAPGFAASPDPRTLRINALPAPPDPLHAAFVDGASIGMLGIELAARRRNRVNGTVVQRDACGFTLAVEQSFGNCPRYIWKRELTPRDGDSWSPPRAVHAGDSLDLAMQDAIAHADTFYVATAHASDDLRNGGADVSHRGGRPGFVRVEDANTLIWPDFNGNAYFNTLGNLAADPRSGLLFADFDSGALLYLSGRGEIDWDPHAHDMLEGAERLVRFHVERTIAIDGALPFSASDGTMSPALEDTGVW
jgi:predicted pyridoxine 5'-phosphate oxidase superfamily flavin-nucleotide-binding protein